MTEEKTLLPTEQVRLRADLVAMLRAIQFSRGGEPIPVIADPILRPALSAMFNRLPANIRRSAFENAGLSALAAEIAEPLHVG